VRIRGFGGEGTVVDDLGDSVSVSIGSMHTVVPKNACELIPGKPPKQRRAVAEDQEKEEQQRSVERIGNLATELDVRGKRFQEAWEIVDRWLDTALLAGFSPLRIIHGKGTGALGTGLQKALKLHPAVKRLRYGNDTEGGGGVTILDV
jgi:DNA mismatch repair protein MutS2